MVLFLFLTLYMKIINMRWICGEFFSLTLNKDIVIDDNRISRTTTWSSEQIYEAIRSYNRNSSRAGQEINKDYGLSDRPIIIITVYLDIADGSHFQFKVLDKVTDGFGKVTRIRKGIDTKNFRFKVFQRIPKESILNKFSSLEDNEIYYSNIFILWQKFL